MSKPSAPSITRSVEETNRFAHVSVMLDGAVDGMIQDTSGVYFDGTFGRGGHSRLILSRLAPQGRLIACDRDPQALAEAASIEDERFCIHAGEFARLSEYAEREGVMGQLDGILLDIGVSSPQLDDAERGFSFMNDGPLDMRMDPTSGDSASEWLSRASAEDMAWVFKTYGEERYAKRLARAVVERRAERPITRTGDFASLIKDAHPNWEKHKHPATRVFQAIRIHINGELDELTRALDAGLEALKPGGRLVVISFHSLEDRIVKRFMRDKARGDQAPRGMPIREDQLNKRLKLIGKAQKASEDEVSANVRSRSAVMRIAEKLK